MKRILSCFVVCTLAGLSSGCSIVDRLFLMNCDGPYAHKAECENCQDTGCRECEQPCRDGACQDDACQDGACQKPQGRFGGLARHHLTRDEQCALEQSGDPGVGPAGPPTGAVAYPYYSTRGPRDFLAKNPPSIGP
ncbi:MAG: hypothetical protein WCR23_06290 [Planctomycetota bacterium]|nr:MAG: hypothetical protein DWH80_14290 [Planctomycetota bacterium]RLS57089.1 MAG: hypothetical protein DWH94_07485 [Planctomycetota bacterium]